MYRPFFVQTPPVAKIGKTMTHGHFMWTDLSTYDLQAARSDYAALFGWAFQGDPAYDFATHAGQNVAAIFPMPMRLAAMDMPSFWMSYIHVEDIEATVEKARTHAGVIIEVDPQPFNNSARIALIRDPSGAGFTVYEGPDISTPRQGAGSVAMRYHHLPDVTGIEPFYEDLFGWTFQATTTAPWHTYDILHSHGSIVAIAEEVPETILGKFRYWMPCFAVPSMDQSIDMLDHLGGTCLADLGAQRHLVADRQGAHFMITSPNA